VCPGLPDGGVSIVAYGDTRTGFFGLGDNCDQAIHAMVMDDILKPSEGIDAVIFTGDAVVTNFPLWKDSYWHAFLSQSDRLVKSGQSKGAKPCVPFFPSLGNHETYNYLPAKSPDNISTSPPQPPRLPGGQVPSSVSDAYDKGEESAGLRAFGPAAKVPDYTSPAWKKQLANWEKSLRKGSQKQRIDSAVGLGAFEGQIQYDFFDVKLAELRAKIDGKLFKDSYIDIAGYSYLAQYIQPGGTKADPRSFYSHTIDRNGIKVKLIALDTNCLDYKEQLDFFRNEVSSFDGPIIVFGHHPPIREDVPVLPWDKIRGWENYKPYMETDLGKNIRLWVFGHVHNYQRRNAAGNSDSQPSAPVVLICGGGGASALDPAAGPNQWQPASWVEPKLKKEFNYARISVTKDAIRVKVYGKPSLDQPFATDPIDSFEISVR
jgi:hypothetical protein